MALSIGIAPDIQRRNQRVESYRRLVRPLAIHYARCSRESSEDLTQVGLLGLIRAAELYRDERNTPFEAFARPHIRGAILHYLRDTAPAVRLPRRAAELGERLRRLESVQGGGENGSLQLGQAQERLGIGREQWLLLLQHRRLSRPLPLDETLVHQLPDPAMEQPEEPGTDTAEALLARLEPRQRRVVARVVLGGMSYRRLASEMGISPMTVQRLLRRGLDRLRQEMETGDLSCPSRPGPAPSAARAC